MVSDHEKQPVPMGVLARYRGYQSIVVTVFATWAVPNSVIVTP